MPLSFSVWLISLKHNALNSIHVVANDKIWFFLIIDQYSIVSIVQSLRLVQLFATQWTAACQASLSSTIFQSLLKLMSIESVMLSNHLILCRPFFFCLQYFPASIRVFSNVSTLHIGRPKYWSFSLCNSPSNEDPGWLLAAIQGHFWNCMYGKKSICISGGRGNSQRI